MGRPASSGIVMTLVSRPETQRLWSNSQGVSGLPTGTSGRSARSLKHYAKEGRTRTASRQVPMLLSDLPDHRGQYFFIRQGTQQIHPSGDLRSDLNERLFAMTLVTLNCRGIG